MGRAKRFTAKIGGTAEVLNKAVEATAKELSSQQEYVVIDWNKVHPYEITIVISAYKGYDWQIAMYGHVMMKIGQNYQYYLNEKYK